MSRSTFDAGAWVRSRAGHHRMTVLVNSVFHHVIQELNDNLPLENALIRRTGVELVSLFDLKLWWLVALGAMVQIS